MAAYVRPSAVAARHSPWAFATSALLLFAEGGLLYDYSHISLRQWTNWVLGWASPLQERKRISAVDLSSSIERKTAVQQVIVLDSLGYSRWQCLNWRCCPLSRLRWQWRCWRLWPGAVGRGCGDYPWAR